MAAGPGGFAPGSLVLVSGLQEKVKGDGNVVVDLNGEKAQLIEWRSDLDLWIASTFRGQTIGIGQRYLRLLRADDFGSCDCVLGPKTNPMKLAKTMAEVLGDKGYISLNVILADCYREEMYEEMKGLDFKGMLQRLPKGFEHGHLGDTGKGKILQLEAGRMPDGFSYTQLWKQDQQFSMISNLLRPYLKHDLGISIQSRTPTLCRLPFTDLEDEAKHLPSVATAAEADQFLELMGRRQVGVLQFLGPDEKATLTLLPRRQGLKEVTIKAVPNTMVFFLAEQYTHKLATSSESLTLSCWYLEAPHTYQVVTSAPPVRSIDSTALAFIGPGASLPHGQLVKVCGIASRDPCNANFEEHFWYALRHAGADGFCVIPRSRFDTDMYVDFRDRTRAMMNGLSYCRHQGQVEGIEYFDEKFFNIPKNEVWSMDPEQRFMCEVGWSALESAGYESENLRRESSHIGVYVGISSSDWRDVLRDCEIPGLGQGTPETFIANRFSFIFNLKGPSTIANTACSASLVSAHAAKLHVLSPHDPLDACVCAGISLNTGLGTWIGNCAGGMLSFQGRSFSFMDGADGYGRGEGAACSIIAKGKYDDEDCHALLAGSNTNSDGRSASLTAPNGPAQQRLLKAILDETNLSTTEVSTYEAHGTGTLLGDPIEVGAVVKVLGKGRQNALCLSCSKTNLGHLEGGAGMSGFIKCVLSVMHSECVPNLHTDRINPNLSLDNFSGQFISEGLAYGLENNYVGVSGFGYGGTNAHLMAYGRRRVRRKALEMDMSISSELTMRKIQEAPLLSVDMNSDNFEEWTTTGIPHLTAKDGDRFHVELQKSGQAVWRQMVEPDLPADEVIPFIQGSFNDAGADMLDTTDIDGLYVYEVMLGPTGAETFSIILDADPDLCFFPEERFCTKRSMSIVGPAVPPTPEHSWVIRGEPDDNYIVEFFLSGTTRTVSWRKAAD